MRWFGGVKKQNLWGEQRWWYVMATATPLISRQPQPPMKLEAPVDDELLAVCEDQQGFLGAIVVLTKDQKLHLGFDLPCCPRHQQKPVTIQVRGKVRKGVPFFGIPTSSTIIKIQPRCAACTQLLKAKLAVAQSDAMTIQ